jgi:hypothetical protein
MPASPSRPGESRIPRSPISSAASTSSCALPFSPGCSDGTPSRCLLSCTVMHAGQGRQSRVRGCQVAHPGYPSRVTAQTACSPQAAGPAASARPLCRERPACIGGRWTQHCRTYAGLPASRAFPSPAALWQRAEGRQPSQRTRWRAPPCPAAAAGGARAGRASGLGRPLRSPWRIWSGAGWTWWMHRPG